MEYLKEPAGNLPFFFCFFFCLCTISVLFICLDFSGLFLFVFTLKPNIHVPSGIRNRYPSKRRVTDPRRKPRGHWARHRNSDLPAETTALPRAHTVCFNCPVLIHDTHHEVRSASILTLTDTVGNRTWLSGILDFRHRVFCALRFWDVTQRTTLVGPRKINLELLET
jgi:hypothetical protein